MTGAGLDALTLLVVIDNESDILPSIDRGAAKLSEVSHLLERAPIALTARYASRPRGVRPAVLGLSWAVGPAQVAGAARRGHLWLSNAERLGVDLAAVEVVFLSHWRFDHGGGLPTVLAAIAQARAAAGVAPPVIDTHPERPHQRGITLATGTIMLFPPEPTMAELTAGGAAMFTSPDPHALLGGLLHGFGNDRAGDELRDRAARARDDRRDRRS